MKPGTVPRPRPATNQHPAHGRSAVRAYLHRDSGIAWLDVVGPLSPPANPKSLLGQLRRAHRRIPQGIDRVGVDLTRLDELTIELAVVLCLESRMLSVRDIQLGIAVREEIEASQGAQVLMERLQIWRLHDDRLADLSRTAAHARLGYHGWQSLTERKSAGVQSHRP